MTPTIIRVKRKFDEAQEIDSTIVLNCKKQKINENDVYSQFSFVGTVEEKENIPDHILKLSKKEAENIVQNKSKELSSGLASRVTENLEKSKEKRFKVVNFMRSSDISQDVSKEQFILDVEKEDTNKNLEKGETSQSKAYVYDIYVANEDFSTILQPDLIDLNDLSILDYNDYLYSCPRLTNDSDDEELEVDSDSNDENNWRNDYPDEEEFSDASIDERAMRRAMQNVDIGNELSSDEDDEYQQDSSGDRDKFVYSIDTEEYGFEDDYDYGEATRHGSSYAKYKKKLMQDMKSDTESSNYGSEDDDDD